MELIIHIAFALISICFTSFMAFAPSEKKLYITLVLSVGTLISGIVLGIDKGTNIAQVCLSGVLYLGFIITAMLIARRKLAAI